MSGPSGRDDGPLSGRRRVEFLATLARAQLRELPGLVRARRGQASGSALELREPPSTFLTTRAHEYLLDVASTPIIGHSLRCWYLADLFAQIDGLTPDPEELYLACALHDVALTRAHRPPEGASCFALHGGQVAAERTEEWGGASELARGVEHAIGRHVDPTGDRTSPSAFLLHEAAFCDVVGTRVDEVPRPRLDTIHDRHPRTGFTDSFTTLMREEARLRPRSRTGLLWRSGMIVRLRLNPLDDRYWRGGHTPGMKVFVLGISGAIGSLLIDRLRQHGVGVAGLVRREEQSTALAARGVEAHVGDLGSLSPAELAETIRGSDVVVHTAGSNASDRETTRVIDGRSVETALEATRLAGIGRFALVSVLPESWRERELSDDEEYYFGVKKAADVAVTRSDLDWMILRPSLLVDDAGTDRVALGPAQLHGQISREDVASTLAELLLEPRIRRQILELDGGGDTAIADAVAANVPRRD